MLFDWLNNIFKQGNGAESAWTISEKMHPERREKQKDYFEKLSYNTHKNKKNTWFCSIPEKVQIASYKNAQLPAKKKKSHAPRMSKMLLLNVYVCQL